MSRTGLNGSLQNKNGKLYQRNLRTVFLDDFLIYLYISRFDI